MNQENDNLRNSFIQALMYPAAELLGEELRKKLENIIKDRNEKKENEHENNLKKHFNAVMERNNNKEKENIEFESHEEHELKVMQLKLIPEWVDGSQNIDPESDKQAILGKLWQDVLYGITNGYKYKESLIDILSSLREHEAKLLLNFNSMLIYYSKPSKYTEKTYFEELKSFGLVENPNYMIMIKKFKFIRKSIVASFYSFMLALILSIGFSGTPVYTISILTVFSIIFILLLKRIKNNAWQLTEKGSQLLAFSSTEK